ncbi:MAG: oxygen-independent coproporphyrinogen III oxidase, partial [Burkholderiales bacterium]
MNVPAVVQTIRPGEQRAPRPSAELLGRFDIHGPRYTSYPTADRFVEAFDASTLTRWLDRRQLGGRAADMSVYVHVPFCDSLCYFCACNKIVTRHRSMGADYLRYLERESMLYREAIGEAGQVSQLHLGGGTPTFLSDDELATMMQTLGKAFTIAPDSEISIEIDPRTADRERLSHLRALGFNRVSFGVQDFDLDVQTAVHRVQSTEQVFDLVASARELGFLSINVDLIYGLPRQTEASFARTIDLVAQLRPDRIALYAYAHLPERFKPQRRIVAGELPVAAAKISMLAHALDRLLDAGYLYIGMDHFALPDDPLAVARRQGRLHRNFQGYTTHPDGDLIALGVSAISRIGPTYSQNAKTLNEYYDMLDQGQLPVCRGIELTRDDLLRRAVIMALMCQGRVSFEAIESAFLIRFPEYFAGELERMREFEDMGLVTVGDGWLEVTPMGWFFVRAVAMAFDRYMQHRRATSG